MRFLLQSLTLLLAFSAAVVAAEEPLTRAQQAAVAGDSAAAVRHATEALDADPKLAEAYYLRGREQFRLGQFAAAVADFDRYVGLRPALASRQWERGIALYYNRQHREGAEQFALYQTFHDNDVENSVWRFLCMVPTDGLEAARAAMLPIQADPRVPMMEIYDLYRGKLSPQEVLTAATAGTMPGERRAAQEFYAHLYVGLYFHALGQADEAARYLDLAARDQLKQNPFLNRYMWDVARVHPRD